MTNWWNLALLGIANALNRSVSPMVIFLGGLIGIKLAPDPIWATVPPAVLVVGMGICAYPVASLMGRVGRCKGFVLLSFLGAASSLFAALAIMAENYLLFCMSMFGVGANIACVQQYRFAAAENVSKERASTAISLVLFTGIAAALLGPEVGTRAKDWIPSAPFAGSFLVIAVLGIFATALIALYRNSSLNTGTEAVSNESERSLLTIARQSSYQLATLGGMIAYGVMSMIMIATPMSMHLESGLPLHEISQVIQSHVAAMYLPSLITGQLIALFGHRWIMMSGLALMATCAGISLAGHTWTHFWWGLVLLGFGWNFLFVASTSLLTRSYRSSERFKAEGLSDFFVFTSMATVSIGAGVLMDLVGWQWLNMVMLPILAGAGLLFMLSWRHLGGITESRPAASASDSKPLRERITTA